MEYYPTSDPLFRRASEVQFRSSGCDVRQICTGTNVMSSTYIRTGDSLRVGFAFLKAVGVGARRDGNTFIKSGWTRANGISIFCVFGYVRILYIYMEFRCHCPKMPRL